MVGKCRDLKVTISGTFQQELSVQGVGRDKSLAGSLSSLHIFATAGFAGLVLSPTIYMPICRNNALYTHNTHITILESILIGNLNYTYRWFVSHQSFVHSWNIEWMNEWMNIEWILLLSQSIEDKFIYTPPHLRKYVAANCLLCESPVHEYVSH